MAYKTQRFPYVDLTGRVISGYKVLERANPSFVPETLNETKWSCECLNCGAVRLVSGRLLALSKPRDCPACGLPVAEPSDDYHNVGRGLIHMQATDKDSFMEYLQKKKIEVEMGRTGVTRRMLGNEKPL